MAPGEHPKSWYNLISMDDHHVAYTPISLLFKPTPRYLMIFGAFRFVMGKKSSSSRHKRSWRLVLKHVKNTTVTYLGDLHFFLPWKSPTCPEFSSPWSKCHTILASPCASLHGWLRMETEMPWEPCTKKLVYCCIPVQTHLLLLYINPQWMVYYGILRA